METFRYIPRLASIFVSLLGLVVFIGWIFHLPALYDPFPGMVTMKANTSFSFMLSAIALWMLKEKTAIPWQRSIAYFCSCTFITIGLLVLFEYALGLNSGIDEFFAADIQGAIGTSHPGRMSPVTAANFVLMGLALLFLDRHRATTFVQGAVLLAILSSLLVLVGNLYGETTFYLLKTHYTKMAVPTAINFIILGIGILYSRPQNGIMIPLADSKTIGCASRRLLLLSVLFIISIGLIHLKGEQWGWYHPTLGCTFMVGANIIVLGALIIFTALKLYNMEKTVEESAQKKSDFASMVSHELRTPMAVINEGIQLVADGVDGPVNDEQREHLGMSLKSLERLKNLVNDVLDFQKLESGKMIIKKEPHDINKLIRETIKEFEAAAVKKHLVLLSKLDESLPPVVCDKDAVTEVVVNLIANAIKFSDKGTIRVVTARKKNCVEVSVADEGMGIHEEDRPKLFQEFSQIQSDGRKKPPGTGLGLAISKKIIELHEGKIGADSDYGKGSNFHFTLPFNTGQG